VVVITRNHADSLGRRVDQLRRQVTAVDTRWWILDLGSVDDSVAIAVARRATAISVPGGRVRPLASLDVAMARCGGDVVLFVDADCMDLGPLSALIRQVRDGADLAGPTARRPGMVAVSRDAWQKRSFAGNFDLFQWAQVGGAAGTDEAGGGLPDASDGLLPLALDNRRRRPVLQAAWHLRERLLDAVPPPVRDLMGGGASD